MSSHDSYCGDQINSAMTEIAETEHSKETKSLFLSGKSIISTKGIDAFINLKRLDLSNNSIRELNGIDKLVNLEILDLSNNKIDTLGFFHNSQSTTSIFIGKNRTVLPSSLIELNLDKNYLAETKEEWVNDTLEAPRGGNVLRLKKLTLKGNNFDTLESLSGMETIRGLEYLDLSDNRISNFGALLACVPFGSKDKLTVRLDGNQFEEEQVANLNQILDNFPHLTVHLDCLENLITKLDRVKFPPSIVTRGGGKLIEGFTHTGSVRMDPPPIDTVRKEISRAIRPGRPKFHLDTVETIDTLCDTSDGYQKGFVDESNHMMNKLGGWINTSNNNLANLISD